MLKELEDRCGRLMQDAWDIKKEIKEIRQELLELKVSMIWLLRGNDSIEPAGNGRRFWI